MYNKYFKRIIDVIVSIVALLVLIPVFIVTAILVKIKLGSPVIYKTYRVGKDEKEFVLFKFRTMTFAKDEHGNLLADEKRVTKLGKLLRSSSIDELPELINVLLGDMSIIGPRPLPKIYLPYYSQEEKIRHTIRPGLTGLAQINGRNSIGWNDKFKYDIEYVQKSSLILDVRIFFCTIIKVFKRMDIGVPGQDAPVSLHLCRSKNSNNNNDYERDAWSEK